MGARPINQSLANETKAIPVSSILIILLITVAPGCGPADPPPRGQASPIEALQKWHHAWLDGNKAGHLECVEQSPEMQDVVAATFDFGSSVYRLYRLIESRFGNEAVETLKNTTLEERADVTFVVPPMDREWAETAHVRMDSSKMATVFVVLDDGTDLEYPMKMGDDEAWRFSSRMLIGKSASDAASTFRSITAIIERTISAANRDTTTSAEALKRFMLKGAKTQ